MERRDGSAAISRRAGWRAGKIAAIRRQYTQQKLTLCGSTHVPRGWKTHLQQPHGDDDGEIPPGAALQRGRPRADAGRRAAPLGGAVNARGSARERPGAVLDRVQAAAVEGVLDAADGVGVVGAPHALPPRREDTGAGVGGDEVGEEERTEDGRHGELEGLQGRGQQRAPGAAVAGAGRAGELGVVEGIYGCEYGEEDGEDGQGWGYRQREGCGVDVLVAAKRSCENVSDGDGASESGRRSQLCLHGNGEQNQNKLMLSVGSP